MMEDFMDGQWHDWAGDDCPVPKGTLVQAVLRGGGGWSYETHPAEEWSWYHDGDVCDITRFRVVEANTFQQDVAAFLASCEAIERAAADKPGNSGLKHAAAYAVAVKGICRNIRPEAHLATALRDQAAYILANLSYWHGAEARKHKEELLKWVN